jgi:hypothetical protein
VPVSHTCRARSLEAAVSLGKALGVTADEARAMLDGGSAAAEIRAARGLTVAEARRQLERRYRPPS